MIKDFGMLDGCMSITKNLASFVSTLFPAKTHPKLLEFGSGKGTEFWKNGRYEVHTIEDNADWVGHTRGVIYYHAPIVNRYYDRKAVEEAFQPGFDIVIHDGPRGSISDREKFCGFLTLETLPRVLVVDDTDRKDGQLTCMGINRKLDSWGVSPLGLCMVPNTDPKGSQHHAIVYILYP